MLIVILDVERMLELFQQGRQPVSRLAATLGLFLEIFGARNDAANHNLDWLVSRVIRAYELDQVRVYFDRYGRYCGHVIWTCVPEAAEQRILEIGPDEWFGEQFAAVGDIWILDFSAQYGRFGDILLDLSKQVPIGVEAVNYFRSKSGARICKRISRRDVRSRQRLSTVERSTDTKWLMFDGESEEFRHSAAAAIDAATRMGMAALILARLPEYLAMPLTVLFPRIRNPIRRQQYRLYTSIAGDPIGFYTWAWMESDALMSHGAKPISALDLGEWNEGLELFLCDAVATDEGVGRVFSDLSGEWYPSENLFVYPCFEGHLTDRLRAYQVNGRGRILPAAPRNASGVLNLSRALIESDA